MLLSSCCSHGIGLDLFKAWSPDGIKTLFCPNREVCFSEPTTIKTDHCCACTAVPKWELPHKTHQNIDVEITSVDGSRSKLVSRQTVSNNSNVYFIYTYGKLKTFPENSCSYNLLHIDVTGNLFPNVGNISCFFDLDTLVMKNNKLTFISNETFKGLYKLRSVDFSYNLITKIDCNVFGDIHILKFSFEGNYIHKLDVTNILNPNKTTCGGNYSKNKHPIEITNLANLVLGKDNTFVCSDYDFSYSSVSIHPLLAICEMVVPQIIDKYAPCGEGKYNGMAFDCDCQIAELMHLDFLELNRVYSKRVQESYCRSPISLLNISIYDVYINQTLRDQMTCDIIDFCPINGACKCRCISQPNRYVMIIDCSNQSCTDFPTIIPHKSESSLLNSLMKNFEVSSIDDFSIKHDVILNMNNNKIKQVNTSHPYFSRVRTLDLTANPIKIMSEEISKLDKVNDIIIPDHLLNNLPKSVELLDPNVFHFGHNGIPCTCENRWIGEWRLYKQAFKRYPYALGCSNYDNKTIEEMLDVFSDCDVTSSYNWIFYLIFPIALLLSFITINQCLHYEMIILKKRLFKSKKNINKWETDIYVSFDEENNELRNYIKEDLEKFFKKMKMTTYIPSRDSWPGYTEEENINNNLIKCKYCLVVQSSGMYDSNNLYSCSRRMEYKLAWTLFIKNQIKKILILNFDSGKPEKFMYSQSRALHRIGMGFIITVRRKKWENKLLEVFDVPLVVNSKHDVQRRKRIQNYLWKK